VKKRMTRRGFLRAVLGVGAAGVGTYGYGGRSGGGNEPRMNED
jgi:hypothetical protein